ncbi:MAG: transposase, partial [Acidobacteria bacterium]|nr:transposase [Acidobacteriota bacterium]
EAGPFKTVPMAGNSWEEDGRARKLPHEYRRDGTAKMLTLFHPASGAVRGRGVKSCTNVVLHGWMKEELAGIVVALPPQPEMNVEENQKLWESWQEGLQVKITLSAKLPPLRMLLVLDNLAGHKTPEMVLWMFQHGIMPLYTPLSGSWLNMAESIQRIIKRRALECQHPPTPERIIELLEATVRGWNREPTSFEWGGKRATRRKRSRERRHTLGGSGAYTRRAIRRGPTLTQQWQQACQTTH